MTKWALYRTCFQRELIFGGNAAGIDEKVFARAFQVVQYMPTQEDVDASIGW